jgi:hypothetical protein
VFAFIIIVLALRHHGPAPAPVAKESGRDAPIGASPTPAGQASPTASASVPPGAPTVPPGGGVPTGPAANLAELIANAGNNGTVKLRPGLYQGGAIITQPVRIVGETQTGGQAFIQSDTKDALSIKSKGVVLQNVQVLFNGSGEVPAISVSENAELETDGVKVMSSSNYGLVANSNASIKATASSFTASNGIAAQIDHQSRAVFTQCNFTDAQTGLALANGSTGELHACAFERDGARTGRGAIMTIAGDKTRVTIDDCRFSSNPSGIVAGESASLAVTNSKFKDNGVSSAQGNWILGLIQVRSGATAQLEGDSFESNAQGIVATNGGTLEINKCRFDGNGLQTRGQLIGGCMAVSANGQGSKAILRNSSISGSASYAVAVMWSARLNVEDTEITGARTVGLLVGDRNGLPATLEAKRCHFVQNIIGVGVCAGSTANIAESECRENNQGSVAFDKGTRLILTKATLLGNRDHGLYVYGGANAEVIDSQIENNARGAQTGMQNKSAMAASLTVQNSRVAGNQVFGLGAYAKSVVTLNKVTLEGNGKTNISRESSAVVRIDATGDQAQASADNQGQESDDGQGGTKRAKKQKRTSDDDARRIIRRFFRPQ